jgi:hypothetical protein
MSASAHTMAGSFPPSSSITGLPWLAASSMTLRPVATLPVKKTLRIRPASHRAAPVSPPPWTTRRTPSGSPASANSAAIRSPVSGIISDA